VRRFGAEDRRWAGEFVFDVEDADGAPLIVKVYGRDAQETRLLTRAWTAAWYRGVEAPWLRGRLHQVEHEGLVTLLASQAGVSTYEVVAAGAPDGTDAVLVLRPVGTRLRTRPDQPWEPALLERMWVAL